jgi:hypothetical protein
LSIPKRLEDAGREAVAPPGASAGDATLWSAQRLLAGKGRAQDRILIQAQLQNRSDKTGGSLHLALAIGAAGAKLRQVDHPVLWRTQDKAGWVGSEQGGAVETALRLLAQNTGYWLSQGQR